ncbi:MAG: hypothetical protein WBM36_06855 [Lysobacterales bacterium]
MNRLLQSVFWILLTLASLPSLFAQENNWPRTVPLGQGMVTIYSPQIDAMEDNVIQYRAALAYRPTAGSEPVFGAGWFESPAKIDSANRIVSPTGFSLTETRFPAGTKDIKSELATVLAQRSPGWNLDFSLDELDSALKVAESELKAVNTTPPKIVYRDHPALLISIDGEPVLREIENSPYKAVINTPYPLISDGKYYYLNAAKDVWYRARQATGPYQFETTPPAAIAAMVSPDDEATTESQSAEPITAANAPEIVVSTEPAELVVTEGPAAFVPLVDDLLVLQNSDDDVFMHVSSQKFYIVLAGRWYQADSLTGPWAYQAADSLPKAFADIPRDSDQADSRVYVAGTEEAKDAVLDAQVPQTAAVKRGEVDIEVNYDGEPVYQPVDGTDLVYIQNTGSTVLVSGGLYYLVEEGVWYVSSSPNGPWQVSDHRPAQVETILPTSPVYNTKYVHVYDSTPSVVYVGYTPGYTGSYVYRNTIFYGTGWYYRPWVSPYYYYPRFSTWGFNVNYNPWSGWNFGLSWGWGPFNVSYYTGGYWHQNHYWHHRHHGRWGPGRYRHRPSHHRRGHDRYAYSGHRRGGRDGGRDRYDGRYDDRRYDNSRDRGGYSRPRDGGQNYNLYRDESQRARVTKTRDKQPITSNRYAADSRRIDYKGSDGQRVQSYTGKRKTERNRTGPVSTSELRSKARVRDVNHESSRSLLLADNSGKVYSKADRKSNRYSRLGGVGSSERSTSLASVQPTRTRTLTNRDTRQSPLTGRYPARQSQQKATDYRQRAPVAGKTSGRKSQAKTPGYDTRQRSSTANKASKRSSQPRQPVNTTRQRTVVAANTPAKQPRQVTSRNSYGKKPVRKVSAPAKRQNSPSPAPQTKSSRSGPQKSSPVQKSSRNSKQKSSYQRSRSKSSSGGGKRNSGRRSGNQ